MTKWKVIAIRAAVAVAVLLVVLVMATVMVIQTSWFSNSVRTKIIAAVEDSVGGRAEIGNLRVTVSPLHLRITNFVLHGLEPSGSPPLLQAKSLDINLKLFSPKLFNIDYVTVDAPQANVMVLPSGQTNIPEPRVKSKPDPNSNSLQTVVDLAVHRFQLDNGSLQFSQQKTAFNARGENLRILLLYNVASPSYRGNIAFDRIIVSSGARPPLTVHVSLPLAIEPNAFSILNGRITTNQSQVLVNASLENMKAPQVAGTINVRLSLPELQRSINLGIAPTTQGAPDTLLAQANIHTDDQKITVDSLHVGLGQTVLDASGTLRDPSLSSASLEFNGNLALTELTRLLNITSPEASGAIKFSGKARLDTNSNYFVDGNLSSEGVSARSGTTRISNINLTTPFHLDPHSISLDDLRFAALGGSLQAKIIIQDLQRLSVDGNLSNFSLQNITQAVQGNRIGYDGNISGTLRAQGDLKAKGTSGYNAQANINIAPGRSRQGVPVSGHLYADYRGDSDSIDLGKSFVALPNSRLDLSGSLNRRLDLTLLSHNLNDFQPALAMASSPGQRAAALPITLQAGGSASIQAVVTGNLASPRITAHAALNRFVAQQKSFDQLALDLAASPSGAAVHNGLLTRNTLRADFDAALGLRKWAPLPRSPLTANVKLRNADLGDLVSLAGQTMPASGATTADVHVNGTYGNPLGNATVQILNGSLDQEPFDRLFSNVLLGDQLITLQTLELSAGPARVGANGTFAHPRESFTTGHAQFHVAASNIQLANLKTVQQQNRGIAGLLQLTANTSADLAEHNKQTELIVQNISADFSARSLRVQNQDAGELTATARTSNRDVAYQISSNFAGSTIGVNGHTTLATDYPTTADLSIKNLSVEKTLGIAGQSSVPAKGTFSADAHVQGTVKSPVANLTFLLADASVYQEPINRLAGTLNYSDTLIDVPSLQLQAPAGAVNLVASFRHPANNLNEGAVQFRVNSSDIQLARIETIRRQTDRSISGVLRLAADAAGNIHAVNGNPQVLLSTLNANLAATALRVKNQDLGQASLQAKSSGSNLNYTLDTTLAEARIHGEGQSQLAPDYPTHATLTFSNIKYTNIAPFVSEEPSVRPSFEALVEGSASMNGPILRSQDLQAQLQVSRLELQTTPRGTPSGAPPGRAIAIRNEGPIVVQLNHMVAAIKQAHIVGPSSHIDASGQVDFKNTRAPLNLNVDANADLGILQDIDRDVYSSGNVILQAAVRGSFAQPLVNGHLDLKNANVNIASVPNGLSNANGTILLNGTSASIQNLTGETGGGKLVLTGYVGLTGQSVTYNVTAAATRVRVRSSGASIVSSATLSLIGNDQRSLLNGRVTVQRIGYQSQSDIGSLLSNASAPVETPTAPSPLLAGMKLDIHIVTAPDLRVVTSYARRLRVEADLAIRGTAATPGVLGRVSVTDGTLVFFGNEYIVNQGTINFYNPVSIQPILNVELETTAQSVTVTLGVQGPMDNLKLSYRSDPPLRFDEIVSLLGSDKTPTTDPNIAASQPTPQAQSVSQMGESAILGSAVASPLASRVQRVFGVSQFKIDPSFQGNSGVPTARVTLQQQVTNAITFTYITDVTQTNSQIIQVEWAFTPQFSAVALRDENGVFGLDFHYKRRIR